MIGLNLIQEILHFYANIAAYMSHLNRAATVAKKILIMKPKGAKQKKPLKQDKAISMSITLPKSQVARLDANRAAIGLSRGAYAIAMMDHSDGLHSAIVER